MSTKLKLMPLPGYRRWQLCIDQVKRGKRMRGASTAACDAGDGVGSSSTGLQGPIGCTTSKVEQEDMKDTVASRPRLDLRHPRCRVLTLTTDATGSQAPLRTATATTIEAEAATATSSHGGEVSPRWAASPQVSIHFFIENN
uniref:Uncharacterized protein n=1 Tax=Oryza meridionalis TaxID=40149 RepID=A0A0E0DVM0_9ORYZ